MRVTRRERIYNSRIPKMHSSRRWFSLIILLAVLLAASAFATEWQAPAEQLARKIAGVTGPGAVALTVQNRSTLTRNQSDEIRRRMLTELGALGLHFVNADQASATIDLNLSEAQQSYIWVAEIRQGTNEPAVVMVSTPRVEGAVAEEQKPATTIKKVLLWTDQSRILDVAILNGSPQHVIVLEGENVLICSQQSGRWQIDQTLPIIYPRPWPRDLRGRLVLRKDHLFDAYLPGVFCRSSTSAPLAISCRESDDPWPLANEPFVLSGFFASSRNFFTGVLSPGIQKQTAVAPFYSAAPLPREKYTLWIFVATDGQLHLLDGITDQAAGRVGWSSDITAVRSSCGSGWQIIAGTSEEASWGAVKAYELPDRVPVAASLPVDLGGNITALWPESDGSGAIVVSQNSESGLYEASRLTISCD